ncbi:MAG TPA: hypothetical protein VK146_02335 [Tabrizicola sp.]|nr:hypothetical protein [Tabrizicola sp.]
MSPTPYPERMALQDLMRNLSAELFQLGTTALEIEDKVGDVIADGLPGGERLLVSLQGLDHLAQTANELAAFVGSVAGAVDPAVSVPVSGHIQAIGLRSLAEALAGQFGGRPQGGNSMGEVDLF